MLRKIWAIAWKDTYGVYTDRSLILIMLVTPLALATIIGLAFSDIASSSPLSDIPVAIVNLDEGDADGCNYGRLFVDLLAPDAPEIDQCAALQSSEDVTDGTENVLLDLTEADTLDTRQAAIDAIEDGDYAAAIIIPADFSQRIAITQESGLSREPVAVEVYGDSGRTLSASVIRSVAEGFTTQIVSGQIAVAATSAVIFEREGGAFFAQNPDLNFGAAFDPALNNVQAVQTPISDDEVEVSLLVILGSAQAAFFALFTASGGATNVIEERRNGTLQRMLVSPTPRLHILLGKLLGVFAMVLLQLIFLFIGFTIINGLMEGAFTAIWGTNYIAIGALIIVTSLAAAGVGTFIASLSSTPEQSNVIGSIVALFMGMLGGAFFQVEAIPAVEPLTHLSIVYWGSDGFRTLAEGGSDILLNLVFLLFIGGGLFALSLFIFSRRQDI